MTKPSECYALILAGGSGTRFWPLSRNARPKQLIDLFGDGTLLEQAICRLDGVIPVENILILTNTHQEKAVREIAGMLPASNIVAEPAKRDTGPAVALGIGLIAARNPHATMMVLPSDQLISDTDGFKSVMSDALSAARHSDSLVTIGIKPSWACPSYGYIERGEASKIEGASLSHEAFEVKRFREKPNPELAEEFLRQGSFNWNAGMFVWSLPTVMGQLKKHAPDLANFIDELEASDNIMRTIAERFPSQKPRSIDYALMESAERVLNIEATFDWDDVGSWISVAKYLDAAGEGNLANTSISEFNSTDNIVYNTRPGSRIALCGVDDLIVVQTEDALLVCNRDRADEIKHLVKKLPDELL